MKKSELKLGDWVLAEGSPIRIDELVEGIDTLSVYDDETNEIKDYSYDELSPIPLTEEILEKNGWREKKSSEHIAYENGWYELFRVGQEGAWAFCHYDDFLTAIKHIHELQHLLWALGMDDDLKI